MLVKLAPVAALIAFQGVALAQQIQCVTNPATGRLEASLAWRNTLGEARANQMCVDGARAAVQRSRDEGQVPREAREAAIGQGVREVSPVLQAAPPSLAAQPVVPSAAAVPPVQPPAGQMATDPNRLPAGGQTQRAVPPWAAAAPAITPPAGVRTPDSGQDLAPSRASATSFPIATPQAPSAPSVATEAAPAAGTPPLPAPPMAQPPVLMNPAGLAAGQAKAPEPESKEQKQLEIRAGSRLMPSIRSWLQAAGYELTWSAPSGVVGRIRDIELTEDFTSESADVRDVLTQVLAPFAFEAEVIEAPSRRRVIVRNARPNL